MPNTFNWDITRIQVFTFLYTLHKEEEFEVLLLNVSMIELFLMKKLHPGSLGSLELRDAQSGLSSSKKTDNHQGWTMEWWHIVPQVLQHHGFHTNSTEPILPPGLIDKLLERGKLRTETRNSIKDAMAGGREIDIITIAFTLIVILSILAIAAMVVCLIVPVALVLSRRYAPLESKADRGTGEEQDRLSSDSENDS